MGFDLGSSQSRTSSRTATQSGPVTSSGGDAAALQQFGGRGNVAAAQGAIVLGKGANLGGTNITVGKGANVSYTVTDGGAFQQAADAIDRIVKGQADNVAAALGSLGNIAETRGTDGANLSADVSKTATKGIFAAAGLGAVLLIVILFLKR
jgi:hypothetical protein